MFAIRSPETVRDRRAVLIYRRAVPAWSVCARRTLRRGPQGYGGHRRDRSLARSFQDNAMRLMNSYQPASATLLRRGLACVAPVATGLPARSVWSTLIARRDRQMDAMPV